MNTVIEHKPMVPKFRFPEFEGDWEKKRLGSLGDFIGGGTPDTSVARWWEGDIPWISSSDIDEGNILRIDISRYINQEAIEQSAAKIVPSGSLLIVSRVGVGKFALTLTEVCTSQDFCNFTPTSVLPKYIGYWLFQNTNILKSYSQGTSIKGITSTDLKSILLPVPILDEQEKIADFLTAVDERVQGLAKKKELLETYKKGVMQKLFSQQIRFTRDDGNPFPNWEKKRLGEISIKPGVRNSGEAINAVLTNSAIKGIIAQQDYFDKDIAVQGNLGNYHVVEIDDFIYNPRISASAPVGPMNRNKLGQGVMSPLYVVVRFTDGNLDFFEHFFATSEWHRYMHSIANIGARHDRMNITAGDFANMLIPYPHHDEQKKIADFLSSIEDKIYAIDQQLNAAKSFKKGLLQKMFV